MHQDRTISQLNDLIAFQVNHIKSLELNQKALEQSQFELISLSASKLTESSEHKSIIELKNDKITNLESLLNDISAKYHQEILKSDCLHAQIGKFKE